MPSDPRIQPTSTDASVDVGSLPGSPTLGRLVRATESETVRFVLTGGGAACLFYLLTFGFVRAGAPPFGGTAAAYAIAFVVSYGTQQAWTFKGQQDHARALPRYLAAQMACVTLSASLARFLAGHGASPATLALGATLASSVLSYTLSRHWVFRRR